MVGAADCRSAGTWFNSGWKSWFIFVTGSDSVMNQIIQMFNNMSTIRTVITTITRKSVDRKGAKRQKGAKRRKQAQKGAKRQKGKKAKKQKKKRQKTGKTKD